MFDVSRSNLQLPSKHNLPLTPKLYFQAMHARSGGSIEVMGILQGKLPRNTAAAWPWVLTKRTRFLMLFLAGKLEENTFVVMDAFALPVEGTETRVTALDEGYEYMVRSSSFPVISLNALPSHFHISHSTLSCSTYITLRSSNQFQNSRKSGRRWWDGRLDTRRRAMRQVGWSRWWAGTTRTRVRLDMCARPVVAVYI